jgi:hypothetical protein
MTPEKKIVVFNFEGCGSRFFCAAVFIAPEKVIRVQMCVNLFLLIDSDILTSLPIW